MECLEYEHIEGNVGQREMVASRNGRDFMELGSSQFLEGREGRKEL